VLKLALACVYAPTTATTSESLEFLNRIYESLPSLTGNASDEERQLHVEADRFERRLNAIEMLDRYGLHEPLAFFKVRLYFIPLI